MFCHRNNKHGCKIPSYWFLKISLHSIRFLSHNLNKIYSLLPSAPLLSCWTDLARFKYFECFSTDLFLDPHYDHLLDFSTWISCLISTLISMSPSALIIPQGWPASLIWASFKHQLLYPTSHCSLPIWLLRCVSNVSLHLCPWDYHSGLCNSFLTGLFSHRPQYYHQKSLLKTQSNPVTLS